jgi:hypothetical protein
MRRIRFTMTALVLLVTLSACSRTQRKGEQTARQVGREAYDAAQEVKRGARKAAQEIRKTGQEIREGWNEAKREDKSPKKK